MTWLRSIGFFCSSFYWERQQCDQLSGVCGLSSIGQDKVDCILPCYLCYTANQTGVGWVVGVLIIIITNNNNDNNNITEIVTVTVI